MKLTLKLACVFLAVTVLVLSIAGYLRVQREVDTFQSTMVQDGRLFGRIIGGMLADTWQTYGQVRVLQLLEDANASTHRFHFSWFPLESLTTALDGAGIDQQQHATLLRGDRVVVKTRDGQGQATLSVYTPVVVGSEVPGAIEVVQSLAGVQRYVHKTILETLGVGSALVILSG